MQVLLFGILNERKEEKPLVWMLLVSMVLLLLIVLVVFSEISNTEAQFNLSFSEKKEHGMKF